MALTKDWFDVNFAACKKENQKVFEAKIKSLTIIVAATLLSISAFAQVGGTVVDQADGSPVAGAAVTIKGN